MASGYIPPNRRVTRLVHEQVSSPLNERMVTPGAPNSHFKGWLLIPCLVCLCLGRRYAESGWDDLRRTRSMPSTDTLLRRLKKIRSDDAYSMLVQANDGVIPLPDARTRCHRLRRQVLRQVPSQTDPKRLGKA